VLESFCLETSVGRNFWTLNIDNNLSIMRTNVLTQIANIERNLVVSSLNLKRARVILTFYWINHFDDFTVESSVIRIGWAVQFHNRLVGFIFDHDLPPWFWFRKSLRRSADRLHESCRRSGLNFHQSPCWALPLPCSFLSKWQWIILPFLICIVRNML